MTGFLDIEARLDSTFLHPGGVATTREMLRQLDVRPGNRILELGCGTGATTVIAARDFGARVVALDRSATMLRSAHSKMDHEAVRDRVQLLQADISQGLPFIDAAFDVVYAESVVALLDARHVCRECARVLHHGGRVALNERIWKSGVSAALASEINTISRRAFGIPAATAEAIDQVGWLELLRDAGFTDVRAVPVDAILSEARQAASPRQRVARWRNHLGNPATLYHSLRFRAMVRRHAPLWDHLESYLFLARMPE